MTAENQLNGRTQLQVLSIRPPRPLLNSRDKAIWVHEVVEDKIGLAWGVLNGFVLIARLWSSPLDRASW